MKCKQCGKEAFNENREWTGFCSPECEEKNKKFYNALDGVFVKRDL